MAVAAAIVAHTHKPTLESSFDDTAVADLEMPEPAACIISGTLGRQVISGTLGVTWQARKISLTHDRLWVGKPEGSRVLDFIPLVEVERIKSKKDLKALQAKNLGRLQKTSSIVQHPSPVKSMGELDRPGKSGLKSTVSLRREEDDMDDEDPERMFVVQTIAGGNNSGKATVLLAGSAEECKQWAEALELAVATEKKRVQAEHDQARTPWRKFRHRAQMLYSSDVTQYCVALIILASYVSALWRSQILPAEDSSAARNFLVAEWIFTMLFLGELIINMAAHWFVKFFRDAWNLYDFIVVVMSVVGLGLSDVPAINVLRVLRVFKILRLFRRLQSLRILITALVDSVIPVMNSMIILLLFTSMYAVVATDLFHEYSDEFFGTFGASLFTLFQVATGDAWSSIVTRTLLVEFESFQRGWVMLFFVSYVLLVGLVLMNIVVAVLLDEFITTVAKEKAEKRRRRLQELKEAERQIGVPQGPLDPLVRGLMVYTNQDDLMRRISSLYARLDIDESGAISLEELNQGLKKIPATQNLVLSQDDFNIVTNNRALLNDEGELTPAAFEVMLLTQVKSFSLRKLVSAMARDHDEDTDDLVFALKSIMSTLDHVDSSVSIANVDLRHKPYLKSRKEVLNRIFKSCQSAMFQRWKAAYYKAMEAGDKDPGAGVGGDETGENGARERDKARFLSSAATTALHSRETSGEQLTEQGEQVRYTMHETEWRREREEADRYSALDARQSAFERELSEQHAKLGAMMDMMASFGAKLDLLLHASEAGRGGQARGHEEARRAEHAQQPAPAIAKATTVHNQQQPRPHANGRRRSQETPQATSTTFAGRAAAWSAGTSDERKPTSVDPDADVPGAYASLPAPSSSTTRRSSTEPSGCATDPLGISLWQERLPSSPSELGSPLVGVAQLPSTPPAADFVQRASSADAFQRAGWDGADKSRERNVPAVQKIIRRGETQAPSSNGERLLPATPMAKLGLVSSSVIAPGPSGNDLVWGRSPSSPLPSPTRKRDRALARSMGGSPRAGARGAERPQDKQSETRLGNLKSQLNAYLRGVPAETRGVRAITGNRMLQMSGTF